MVVKALKIVYRHLWISSSDSYDLVPYSITVKWIQFQYIKFLRCIHIQKMQLHFALYHFAYRSEARQELNIIAVITN
ncbi:hypothetical protein X975_24131, partial [Stegodyphus mimosarum]